MMLFLPTDTWLRLVIFFSYGYRQSTLGKRLAGQEE
jgi:hypothetical protein